jgi:UDPglucose--hexose-1-phosphate uridylyltransferase
MELRRDYILNRWVIISEGRSKRKHEYVEHVKKKKGACFFCPGNEATTPPEIGRVPKGKGWLIRWFPNKFPAVAKAGMPEFVFGDLTHGAAYGSHEVVAETPDHDKQLWDLSLKHITQLMKVWSHRITELSKEESTKYVLVFKNHGEDAGTSLIHSHTQIASVDLVPPLINEEVRASKKGGCAYCDIIKRERKSPRFISDNGRFVSFAPYASRFNYEAWIFPKRHVRSITDFREKDYELCAESLMLILRKLRRMGADYNFWLHYSPQGKDLHFHIEVAPRIATWAGFEYASGVVINSVPPEEAAKYYRSR